MIKSTLQSKSLLSWCLVPMTRNSVLSSFSSNLPSISHFFKSCMHPSIACSSSSCALWSPALKVQLRIFCETVSLGEVMLDNLKERWNVNDEKQECQKRTLRYATVKWELLMDTWWLRFDRYELNQSSTFPSMPTSLRSHSNKILRSTVSNAALRSNRTIRVTCC